MILQSVFIVRTKIWMMVSDHVLYPLTRGPVVKQSVSEVDDENTTRPSSRFLHNRWLWLLKFFFFIRIYVRFWLRAFLKQRYS